MTLDQGLDMAVTVLDYGTTLIGSSAVIAAVLPKTTTRAVKIFTIVRKVVDFLGANVFNAKNAE